MALTLDGIVPMPLTGTGSGMSGLGAGAVGGGLLGLIAGSLLSNGGGLGG
ncbi:MAG: hypothetical protein ACOH2V_00750 [Candidatus Saccharimonadaceae bacterium]